MKDERDDSEEKTEEEAGEAASSEQDGAAAAEEREKLVQALEQKTKEAAEANEKYLRTYADFENYRKRMQRDLAEFRKYANEQLVLELLPVVDHLGLALKHGAEAGEAAQGLQQGVEQVYKQLRDVLEKSGVKRFSAEGEPFDPAKHEAMMQVLTADVPENTVVQVFQDGYLYHEKVLRHAKVSVSKKPQPEPVGSNA
ncbi:MAG: nucleotide exchange factor GrpE [Nitrospirae bacterium GWD2_57_9]|nr:MAG: nucleotide exchange factor GrpE [Nitrospirae bacterium GWD2_57_9]OGW48766.1 MAG: nucleotide exchange factor GrpE [Nitrospirae bacterium GWC2_57_9]